MTASRRPYWLKLVLIVGLSGCAFRTDQEAIHNPNAPLPVAISPEVTSVHYGVLQSPIPAERVVETTEPPHCEQNKPMSGACWKEGLVAGTVHYFWLPIVVVLAPIAIVQKLTEPASANPKGGEKYAEWLQQSIRNEQQSIEAGHFRAFVDQLGWSEAQSAFATAEPAIKVSVIRIALLETQDDRSLILLCGRSTFGSRYRPREMEVCRTTELRPDEKPALGDTPGLNALLLAEIEKLGRLQAKAMTMPVSRGSAMEVAGLVPEAKANKSSEPTSPQPSEQIDPVR